MSILIKGMDMPTDKELARTIIVYADGSVWNRYEEVLIGKAIPVLSHGRLIDADTLEKIIKAEGTNQAEQLATRFDPVVRAYGDCYGMVKNAPTIIEAEGETDV